MPADAVALAVFNSLLASVAEEMGASLIRSSMSPNIRERHDLSCAVFDAEGNLVAQAAHIPVHLGAMPASVAAVQPLAPFVPGDIVILNDPYLGGSHLPDVTMVSPVFTDSKPRRLIGYVASRAHQSDIGGMSPGSMPLASELIQEGLIIPPVRLYTAGHLNEDVLALILRNVRTPVERRGDFEAQVSAQRTGERRLMDLATRYGTSVLRRRMADVQDYAERLTRARLQRIPEGTYTFQDQLDNDGTSNDPVPINVTITVRDGTLEADFEGTAPERAGSINAVPAVARSAVYYAVFCLMGDEAPINAGGFRPITVKLPPGSILAPQSYRAVSAGNVETSQRIVDTVFGALARALPDVIPAASSGSMNNVLIGGVDTARGRRFTYYETLAGGAGGGPEAPGLSAVHTHMTNTLNTPVEAIEPTYPFRIAAYSIRPGTGGKGSHPGGDGLRRAYEFVEPAEVTLVTERRRYVAWGLAGGEPGAPGRNLLVRGTGEQVELPAKATLQVQPGDTVIIETPGGGGWGAPV
jgi:N-methylhydantoinase B